MWQHSYVPGLGFIFRLPPVMVMLTKRRVYLSSLLSATSPRNAGEGKQTGFSSWHGPWASLASLAARPAQHLRLCDARADGWDALWESET